MQAGEACTAVKHARCTHHSYAVAKTETPFALRALLKPSEPLLSTMHPLDDYIAGLEVHCMSCGRSPFAKSTRCWYRQHVQDCTGTSKPHYEDLLIRPKMRLKAHYQAQAISASSQLASQAAMNSTLFACARARGHHCGGRALTCSQRSGPTTRCGLSDVAIGALQIYFGLL